MSTILYNSEENRIIARFENSFIIDGNPYPVSPPIYELTVINSDPPAYDYSTQNISNDEVFDIINKEYRREYTITDKSQYEIDMQTWSAPEYSKRIIAPISLIMDDFGIKMYGWFNINNLPVITRDDIVELYCNSILPEHQFVIDNYGELLSIEERPVP
jgi:hypothetical protein